MFGSSGRKLRKSFGTSSVGIGNQNMSENQRYKVYALCASDEPLQVRYVGVTKHSLEHRRYHHLYSPTNSTMRDWFAELQCRSVEVIIRELSRHETAVEANEAEAKWISFWSEYCESKNECRHGYKNDARITPWIQAVIDGATNGPMRKRCLTILCGKYGKEIGEKIYRERVTQSIPWKQQSPPKAGDFYDYTTGGML